MRISDIRHSFNNGLHGSGFLVDAASPTGLRGESEANGDAAMLGRIYDGAGALYRDYADGHGADLFAFDGPHGYADRRTWTEIEARLKAIAASGQHRLSVLDAGCGPATWLRRIALAAPAMGFTDIHLVGLDLSAEQLRAGHKAFAAMPWCDAWRVDLRQDDFLHPPEDMPESFDLVLCLYGVLNHVTRARLPAAVEALARRIRGHAVISVRSAGSLPSIFFAPPGAARRVSQNNRMDRCSISMRNGDRIRLPCHLFSARELHAAFADWIEVEDVRAVDIFHQRFRADPDWNPQGMEGGDIGWELEMLESRFDHQPGFIDRGMYIMLTGRAWTAR